MQKELSEMSLEELWQLFPIQLSEPQPHWINWYEEEAHYLKKLLSLSEELRISHIGSTAISGIWAKPIIDLLIEVADDVALVQVEKTLIAYRLPLTKGTRVKDSQKRSFIFICVDWGITMNDTFVRI